MYKRQDYYKITKEKTARKVFFISAVFFMALHFAAGLLNTPSSRVFYVVLPYAILFFPGIYFVMGAFTFNRAPEKMEFPTYEKSIVRIRRSLRGMIWGLGYLMIAETIFMVIRMAQSGLKGCLLYTSDTERHQETKRDFVLNLNNFFLHEKSSFISVL